MRSALFNFFDNRIFFGWVVLGVAVLGLFGSGPGQSHTFSVFVEPIGRDLGISATELATAYGLATLAASFGLPYLGRIVDRYGPRRMLVIVAGMLGLACMVFAGSLNFVWLAAGFGALRFFGQGALSLNCANMVSQWFDKKRGFAIGLMSLGFALSMAIHPPLSQWMIDLWGWRVAWIVLGISTWAILLPAILLLAHDKPEDVGRRPDGVPATAADAAADAAPIEGINLSAALRTPAFYIIAAGLFTLSMLVTCLHFYQVSIFSAQGLSARTASSVFAVSAASMVVSMPLLGRMLDRFPTHYVFIGGLAIMVASLVSAASVETIVGALVYAVIFGVNNACTMTFFGYMWPRYFGRRYLGSVQGAGQMVGVFGASLGPIVLGIAVQEFGRYDVVLAGSAILPVCCIVAALFLRPPSLAVKEGTR